MLSSQWIGKCHMVAIDKVTAAVMMGRNCIKYIQID